MKWEKMEAALKLDMTVLGLSLAVCLATAAVFWPARTFEFIPFDDDINIYLNPHLGRLDGATLSWMLTDIHYMRRYIPAGWIGFGILYQFFGLNPHGYHAANILLHSVNVFLVIAICREVIVRLRPDLALSYRAVWPAVLAGAWWAWHPLRVETVAWASAWMHIQAMFFLLASFYFYITRHEGTFRGGLKLLASLGLYAISLATYPLALGYPAVLLFWEMARLQRKDDLRLWSREWRRRFLPSALPVFAGFGLAALIFGGMTLYTYYHANSFWSSAASYDTPLSIGEKIWRAVYVWGYYFFKPWWPFHPLLVQNRLDRAAWHEEGFFPCLLAFSVALWIFFGRKASRHSGAWAAGGAYLALLVPVLGVTQASYFTSDRYTYLCSLPLVIALAAWLATCENFLRRCTIGLVLALIVLGQSYLSRSWLFNWKDADAFFARALKMPSRPGGIKQHLYCLWTNMLTTQGRFEQARVVCRQGLMEFPGTAELNAQNLQIDKSEKLASRIAHELEMTVPLSELPRSHFWIALQKIEASEWREAADHLSVALKEAPDYYPAQLKLAGVLTMQGKTDEALACYLRALTISDGRIANGERADFLFMLASASAFSGQDRLARIALSKGQELRDKTSR
jgi:protein O-mannosyl-transferase